MIFYYIFNIFEHRNVNAKFFLIIKEILMQLSFFVLFFYYIFLSKDKNINHHNLFSKIIIKLR